MKVTQLAIQIFGERAFQAGSSQYREAGVAGGGRQREEMRAQGQNT